jgi:diguanylate cyclase (GGDEF)-like protein
VAYRQGGWHVHQAQGIRLVTVMVHTKDIGDERRKEQPAGNPQLSLESTGKPEKSQPTFDKLTVAATEDSSSKVTARSLATELAKVSPDSDLIIEHLRGKTGQELKNIAALYKDQTRHSLSGDLEKNFTGSDRIKVSQALQGNFDDTTRVRANLVALTELSGKSNQNIEKDLRDTFATLNKEQIDTIARQYQERFKRPMTTDLERRWLLSPESKQALEIYLKGSENRTSADTQTLATIAINSKNIDMMREAFREASPEARQTFLSKQGEQKIREAFNARETDIALDYVKLGRLDITTAIKHNSSFAGDNEQAIYFAASNMTAQQKANYSDGRRNEQKPMSALSSTERQQVEFYRKLSAAFKDPLSEREMLICEDKIVSPGGRSTVSKIAELGGAIGANGREVNALLKAMPKAELERLRSEPQFRKDMDSALKLSGMNYRERFVAVHMLDEIVTGKYKPAPKGDETAQDANLRLAERISKYTHISGDDKAGFINSLKNAEASRLAAQDLAKNPRAMDNLLNPSERQLARTIIEQGGKSEKADELRASILAVSKDKASIASVLEGMTPEQRYQARGVYEHKYQSSLINDINENTRGRERLTTLDLMRTPYTMREDYNNRRDSVYNSVDGLGRAWVERLWDGTSDQTHDVLEQYAAANTRYSRDFMLMQPEERKHLSENLNKALNLYKDSKNQAADATVAAALTGTGLAGAAFTGGASLTLLATAGAVVSVGTKAAIEGADYNKGSIVADGLTGAVSAGTMGFGGRQLAEMLKLGQQAAVASADAVVKGSETIAKETGVALVRPGAKAELEQALAGQIRDSIASGADTVSAAKLDKLARKFATSEGNASALNVMLTMELNKALNETGTSAVKRVVKGVALGSAAGGVGGVGAGTVHGIDEWSDKKSVKANMAHVVKTAATTGAEYMTLAALGQSATSCLRQGAREGVKKLESTERLTEAKNIAALASDAGKLEASTTLDPITNLLNKTGSEQALVRTVKQIERAEAKGGSRDLTLMMIDLDNFKAVNDNLGHDRGDEVLKVMGKYLKDRMRASDKVGRLGGDEYLAVLPDTKDTAKLVKDIQSLRLEASASGVRILPAGVAPSPGSYVVKASAGATTRRAGEGASDLLARADHEMYLDKAARKGKVVDTTAKPSETAALSEELRREAVMHRVVSGRREEELLNLNAGRLREISEGLKRDVTTMQERENIDPLTGLLNGKTIRTNLETLVAQSERALAKGEERHLTVVYIDMDGLKGVNDKLGHQNGDQSLRFMGQKLKELARDTDYVSHISGDEYMMLLPDTNGAQAIAQRLDKLRFAMQANGETRPLAAGEALKEGEVKIGFSAGIVVKQPGETAEMVRQRADALMHENKMYKKTHQVFYASEIPAQLEIQKQMREQGHIMEADKLLNDIQFAREHQYLAGKRVREEREGLTILP